MESELRMMIIVVMVIKILVVLLSVGIQVRVLEIGVLELVSLLKGIRLEIISVSRV